MTIFSEASPSFTVSGAPFLLNKAATQARLSPDPFHNLRFIDRLRFSLYTSGLLRISILALIMFGKEMDWKAD